MRTASVDAATLADEVAGTSSTDRLLATAWRGGVVVADGLDLSAWSLPWDASRQVQGQATFTIADPDGTLAPWAMSDPLGPGGSRLQVTYRFGASGTVVPLGWYRLRQADPREQWRTYAHGGAVQRVSGGGSVTVRADEETSSVVLDRLDPGLRVPVTRASIIGEVTRLVEDYMAVQVLDGVEDRAVPAGLTYDESRMDAVEDLLAMIGATYRMSGERVLQVLPRTGIDSGWTVDGGEAGALISVTRSLSDDGVYNGAYSTGQTAAGAPLVGRATLDTGDLAWGGDYGRVPIFHSAIATTAAGVQRDAETTLATRQASGEIVLAVECLTHPGIQVHDLVTVVAATASGGTPLVGRVVGMSMSSAVSDAGTTPAKRMSLDVAVTSDALTAVGWRVSRDAR